MDSSHKQDDLIESKYTQNFVIRFCAIALMGFASFGAIVFLFLDKRLGSNYFNDLATLSSLQEQLPTILILTSLCQATILCLIIFLLSLIWSHAISGPLVRVRKELFRLSRGQLSPEVTFRKNDQIQPLARALRNAQSSLKNYWRHLEVSLNNTDRLLDEYKILKHDKRPRKNELEKVRMDIERSYEEINKYLSPEDAA